MISHNSVFFYNFGQALTLSPACSQSTTEGQRDDFLILKYSAGIIKMEDPISFKFISYSTLRQFPMIIPSVINIRLGHSSEGLFSSGVFLLDHNEDRNSL